MMMTTMIGLISMIQGLAMSEQDGPMEAQCLVRIELEHIYFCGSNFIGNNLGYNPNVSLVYPVVTRKMARRSTSKAPSNQGPASLEVVVKRVSLLLDKPCDLTPLILHTLVRMDIHSCCQLYQALRATQDNQELARAFKTEFEEASGVLVLCDKQSFYFRCTSMYMNRR